MGTSFVGVVVAHLAGGNLDERRRVRGASEHGLGPVCGALSESAQTER